MKVAERATPIAAMIAALSTLACCLPFGFLGAMGLAGVSVGAQYARPWLLGGALGLLVLGFVQLCCIVAAASAGSAARLALLCSGLPSPSFSSSFCSRK